MEKYRPTVVIVGGGFAGIHAAKALRNARVNVVLIDRNNYHLFQPLLYQVATAGLSPSEIAYPLRAIFRHQKNFRFSLAEVNGVDFNQRIVITSNGSQPFDYLILGVGGQTHFLGLDSIEQHGYGLKDLGDALRIRNHLLKIIEQASKEKDLASEQALLTFVIVGGGPTGVECAGSFTELIHLALAKDFPEIDCSRVRVILLEASDRLLPGFPTDLGENAVKTLEKKGVEVRLHAQVDGFDGKLVLLKGGEVIPAYTLIWAAGVRAEPVVDRLGLTQSRQGRVVVEPTLQVPGYPGVFVVGDAAYLEEAGKPLPMMAPVAIQQGKTAAHNIQALLSNQPMKTFQYKDPGSLATIGRNAAVARVKGLQFHGFPAWIVWLVVHLFWLIGFRNRLLVMINWAWDYFFYERAMRLIMPEGDQAEGHAIPVDLSKDTLAKENEFKLESTS